MKGIQKIYHNKKEIAVIFRANFLVHGVQFFTDEYNPFQVGAQLRPKGTKLIPHTHSVHKPLEITSVQEFLIVQQGKIRITFYSTEGAAISNKILRTGDSILIMSGGHGIEFLENSRLFEIKQGPHPSIITTKLVI